MYLIYRVGAKMNEIILVGTVHVDILGPERLKKILEKEKPDVVTIECAAEYYESTQKIKDYINKKKLMIKYSTRKIEFAPFNQSLILELNRETLLKFFSIIYYECIIAKEYAEKNQVKLICVDKKEYVEEASKELRKDIKKGALLYFSMIPESAFKLPIDSFQKFVDDYYNNEKFSNKKISQEDPTKLLKRNQYSVDEILKIKAKKILHIGGANHIFENSPNMYDMLKAKGRRVRRLKLIEADK